MDLDRRLTFLQASRVGYRDTDTKALIDVLRKNTFDDIYSLKNFVDKLNSIARKNIYVSGDREVIKLAQPRMAHIFEVRWTQGSKWISVKCGPHYLAHCTVRCNFRLRFKYYTVGLDGNPLTIRLNDSRNASCLSHAFPVHWLINFILKTFTQCHYFEGFLFKDLWSIIIVIKLWECELLIYPKI